MVVNFQENQRNERTENKKRKEKKEKKKKKKRKETCCKYSMIQFASTTKNGFALVPIAKIQSMSRLDSPLIEIQRIRKYK